MTIVPCLSYALFESGTDYQDRPPQAHSAMPDPHGQRVDPDQPEVYQFRVKGHLSSRWQDWFEGLRITLEEDGETLLTGPVTDQAALYGLLRKVRDVGLPLLSVVRVEPTKQTR